MNAALLDTDMTSEVLKQRNVNVGQHSKKKRISVRTASSRSQLSRGSRLSAGTRT